MRMESNVGLINKILLEENDSKRIHGQIIALRKRLQTYSWRNYLHENSTLLAEEIFMPCSGLEIGIELKGSVGANHRPGSRHLRATFA
eukprot:g78826.t1